MTRRVKGTQDLLNMRIFDAVIAAASRHFSLAHFSHIDTPIIEYATLFQHSVGENTDIVTKEMYTFSPNNKEVMCLRPEATAATMRAFIDNRITDKPWNVFSYGPMFRHERPQKGRYRQFYQFNLERIGVDGITHDAQLIALLEHFFLHTLRITDFVLSINYLGTPADRAAHREALLSFIKPHRHDVCDTCKTRIDTNLLRIFDCKNECCQSLYANAPHLTNHLSTESEHEWNQLNSYLDLLGVSRIHNPFLVRGLDYYQKTVFEFSSPLLGAQSAFCGGGQYDLSGKLGLKEHIPGTGAAIGIDRLLLLLEESGNSFSQAEAPALHAIIPFTDAQKPLALLVQQTLQHAGLCSDIFYGGIKKGLKKADKSKARYALLIGEDEQASESVSVKCMETGESTLVGQGDLVRHLQN